MADVVKDVHKHVTNPIIGFVDKSQKKARNKAARILETESQNDSSATGEGTRNSWINRTKKKRNVNFAPGNTDGTKGPHGYALESIRHWDVSMVPVQKKFKMPSVRSTAGLGKLFVKKRRITIELYKKVTPEERAHNIEHQRRVFNKLYSKASMVHLTQEDEDEIPPLDDDDFVFFRVLKAADSGRGMLGELMADDDDDDESHSSLANGDLEAQSLVTYRVADYGDVEGDTQIASRWKEQYRTRLETIEITAVPKRPTVLQLQLGAGDTSIMREVCFDSPHEVETFVRVFEKMRELQFQQGARQMAEHVQKEDMPAARGTRSLAEETKGSPNSNRRFRSLNLFGSQEMQEISNKVNLLVEIVSATNLPIADVSSSDPYVIVLDGPKELHRTGVISKTLNPVWTLSTGSLFLIQTRLKDFFSIASRIEFVVKDYDSVGENDVLGSVLVNKNDMLNAKGERLEFPLTGGDLDDSDVPLLSLRCRTATKEDIQFMYEFEAKKNTGMFSPRSSSSLTGVFNDDCYLPPRYHRSNLIKRQERKAQDGIHFQHRMKPFPDPSRPMSETKWMTDSEIELECKKPSQQWIEAGTGSAAKFYVEILGCDGLPNMDLSVGKRRKSDPFVCIAFEDCVVNTDVINNCLSPRWMPWTQRAFVFNVMHPSSQFFIAVMDYDEIIPGSSNVHDKLGRCILNPTNARPNTVYMIRMSLFSSDEKGRTRTGKIQLRLRYESADERVFLFSALQFREHYTRSTNSSSDFDTTRYALTNDYDCNSLSLQTIQKYVDELTGCLDIFDDIVDAVKNVILWRGHFDFFSFKLPIHSMIAFGWGILLSNDFDRIISFICFFLAWILLATLECSRKNPNPWKRPRTYLELIGILLFNKSFARHTIVENENVEAIMEYDENRFQQAEFRKQAIETMRIQNEFDAKHMEEESKELDKQATNNPSMTVGYNQFILKPFKDILEPVQSLLYKSVVVSRIATSIIMWKDSVMAFWVVTIALTLCFVTFYIPWALLLHWVFTATVWVFLGPWMKIVDIFFVEDVSKLNYKERQERIEAEYKKRYDYILGESKTLRRFKEHCIKERDMERYMFGQHACRVPIFKEERFSSVPLAGGSAHPCNPSTLPPVNIVRRINGQLLTGDMIPRRENPAKDFNAKARKASLSTEPQVPFVVSTKSMQTVDDEKLPLLEEGIENDDGDGNDFHDPEDTFKSYGTINSWGVA